MTDQAQVGFLEKKQQKAFARLSDDTGWRTWRWIYVAIAAVTLAAHLPEITGWVSCNPIYGYPGMVQDRLHHLLPGRCSVDANDGITLQALGGRAAEMWLHGRLPWWNSYAGLGLPLAAEAQPAAFFLPFVLLLHFFAGLLILKIVLQMLAGIFMAALCRELTLGRPAAGVGGMLFALNGSFAWFSHSPVLPVAFLPALLFGLERCRNEAIAGRAGGPAWVALALAFSLLAGFPETAFMDGLLAAAWAAMAVLRTPEDRRRALAAKICCGGLAGLALSAPAWISFLDYLRVSSVGIHNLVIGNHLAPDQTPALLMPAIYGPPYAQWAPSAWSDEGGYFGPALGLLAILGVLSGRQLRAVRVAMAAWIVVWLSVFLGAPLTHAIWVALPPLNEVQVTRYAMPSIECAAAILAALAIDDWRGGALRRRTHWAAALFVGLACLTMILGARAGRLSLGLGVVQAFHVAAVLEAAVVVGTLTWLLSKPTRWRYTLGLMALVTADAVSAFIVPELGGETPNRLNLAPVAFLQSHAGPARVFTLNEQFPVNYGSWFGVAQIQADSMPFAQAWNDAAVAIGGDINMGVTGWLVITPAMQLAALRNGLPGLAAAGVQYVVVDANSDPLASQALPSTAAVFEDGHTRIYKIRNAAPYVTARGASCDIKIVSREEVRTICSAPAMLLRRELQMPGWHASVNGRKAELSRGVLPGQTYLQELHLPAGQAEVRWRYAPPHAMAMGMLCSLGALATLGMAVLAFQRQR